jgi:glucosamine--fructose-6-phosphate aminotransferase (isomerizing)
MCRTAIEQTLELTNQCRQIAARYIDANNWLYLGRGMQYPIALEGALKLKEISYIHAEGLPAAEMKHGPIALITKACRWSSSRPQPPLRQGHQQHRGGPQPRRARDRGRDRGRRPDPAASPRTCSTSRTCRVEQQPLVTVIPLQLMAYHAAVLRGCDVDKPRNLAKSVTVE